MIPDLVVVALDFYRDPKRFPQLRDALAPLPSGVTELLAAPARCLSPEQVATTAQTMGAKPEELAQCVPFFAKQALLDAGGDYYRALGVSRDADASVIKQHYHYLMRMFHPDKDVHNERWDELYAPRINEAYNTLRNSAKRAAYDATLSPDEGFSPAALQRAVDRDLNHRVPVTEPPVSSEGLSPRAKWVAVILLVLVVGLFTVLVATQNRQPVLRVDDKAQQVLSKASAGREDIVVRNGEVQFSTPTEAVAAAAEPSSVRREPVGDSSASQAPAATTADQRVEEMVRQRVAQARVAVLGSRPAPSTPKPTAAPAVTELAAAKKPEPSVPAPRGAVEEVPRDFIAQDALRMAEEEAARADVPEPVEPSETPEEAAPPVELPHQADTPVPEMVAEVVPEPSALTEADVTTVLAQFIANYQAGDARAFSMLFAEQADTTDAKGRDRIFNLYSEFFALPETRRVQLGTMRWREVTDQVRVGTTAAKISVFPNDGSAPNVVETDITFIVARTAQGLMITGMHY